MNSTSPFLGSIRELDSFTNTIQIVSSFSLLEL